MKSRELVEPIDKEAIFLSGIGGSGMSAIACFMSDKGHTVIGSDRAFDRDPEHPLRKILDSKGIRLTLQNGSGIDRSFDTAIFSSAVEPDNAEFLKAISLGIPVKTRAEYLSEILSDYSAIAVAGTSGKSTTSGMLAFLMRELGLMPNFIGGGRVKQFKSATNPGNLIVGDSDSLIIEACESDGSIVNYRPLHSIILNISLDHNPIEKTAEMFRTLINNTSGRVFLNADDAILSKLADNRAVTFSIKSPSEYKAEDVVYESFGSRFSIMAVEFSLSIPGRYNIYNALPCIALLHKNGIPLEDIAAPLHKFSGIERRFDIHLNNGKNIVVDDYAHNPHKIESLMMSASKIKERVCYIFQPHGFGPTKMMKNEYVETFTTNLRVSDHLILLPIFYAGGTTDKDISSSDLAVAIANNGRSVEAAHDREAVFKTLALNWRRWEGYVIFGARDDTLSNLAEEIGKRLKGLYPSLFSKVK
ncbi:MAG: Mur ligase domain-containing protein [Nitrospirae bacterium]|nr:Mur ligase domain-containing protein [Nitrospirota bacterium]